MSRLLLVSNRLPVTVQSAEQGVEVVPSAGGLATGIKGPHERSGGLWIGWPGDVSTMDDSQAHDLQRQLAEGKCVPLLLTPEQVSRYYEGYSNTVIWPLFHYLLGRVADSDDWSIYQEVNELFANEVVAHYQPGDIIWVHDYQLTLVPGLLRQRLPEAQIGYFLHIPFPSSEIFRTLPSREAVLEGILGADLIGFHAFSYLRHFTSSVLELLGIDSDTDRLVFQGREVRLGAYPMGIDAAHFSSLASSDDIGGRIADIRGEAEVLLLGIDRLDYTKGIPQRLAAVGRLLEREPELRGKLKFIQLAVPSRSEVEAYKQFRSQIEESVGRINGAFASLHSSPIHYLHTSVTQEELVALYRAADIMLVTPIRDGMNLVAKEFIASRVDEDGVLVLSELTGAAAELRDALMVNPFDTDAIASAISRALRMEPQERKRRMRALRQHVVTHTVQAWAELFIDGLRSPEGIGPQGHGPTPQPKIDNVLADLVRAESLVLMLDYDGTLVGFAPAPEQAGPDDALLDLLRRLAARPQTQVHVVTGRTAESIEEFIGDLPIALHAEHGFFWRPTPHAAWQAQRDPDERWKERVKPVLDRYVDSTPGTRIEEKHAALAWHYRQAEPALGAARSVRLRIELAALVGPRDFEVLLGNKVVEVRPSGIHKGIAVQRVMAALGDQHTILALGDDRTDEDMFAALRSHDVAVHVGQGITRARLRVAGPEDARRFLAALL